jgi:hypothetical protein
MAMPRAAGLAGLLAIITWTELAIRVVWPALREPHWPGYWAAARLALDGRVEVLYADAATFGEAARGYGSVPDVFSTNAPTGVLPFVAFGLLPEMAARVAWLLLGLALFAVAWSLLLRAARVPTAAALGMTALVPIFQPLREDIGRGQAYLVLLSVVVLAAVAGGRSARLAASLVGGLAIGAAAILKLWYGLALTAVALFDRRGRVVLIAMVALGVAALASAAAWGLDPWRAYVESALAWRTRPETTVTAYQTVNGLLGHLLRFDPAWNPGPVIDAPGLVTPAWTAVALLLGGGTILVIRRTPSGATGALGMLPVAIGTPVALLLAPIAEDYHYVLALLPLVVGGLIARDGAPRSTWAMLILAGVLLAAPWPFNVPDVAGWSALLHYPRVYGAAILWAVLVILGGQQRAPVA